MPKMTPSLIRASCGILAFLAPSYSFQSSPFPRPSKNNPSANMSLKTPGNRADYLRGCAAAVVQVASITQGLAPSSATTPTTMVNSVLSAYGIPMISNEGEKFTSSYVKVEDDGQSTICAFAYPANWVETKKRDGLMTAANYQTGDGLILNVGAPGKAKAVGDLRALEIVAEATPSEGVAKILQEVPEAKGGVNYTYLTVKYNTVTRSGYDVERISYISATVRQRRLFTLVATVSSERRNKMDLELNAIRASFRVGDAGVVKASE